MSAIHQTHFTALAAAFFFPVRATNFSAVQHSLVPASHAPEWATFSSTFITPHCSTIGGSLELTFGSTLRGANKPAIADANLNAVLSTHLVPLYSTNRYPLSFAHIAADESAFYNAVLYSHISPYNVQPVSVLFLFVCRNWRCGIFCGHG